MPTLLSPLSFATLTLRNRIVMPPMWSGKATPDGHVTGDIIEYHRVRAAAGCGLVIVEHAFVHPRGRHSSTQLGVYDDRCGDGLARLAAAIKAEGAIACLQISHAGSRGSTAAIGQPPMAPSAIRHPNEPQGDLPIEMTEREIGEAVTSFGEAASRAARAGFDAVEIHAAHGFLLGQFLSPLTNRRTDGFGGTERNRMRLHLDVLAEVRFRFGAVRPVFVRLGAHDEWPGGVDLDCACHVAHALVDGGAALIDVSGGLRGSGDRGRGPGYFVPYAAAMKQRLTVPVLVAGGIVDPLYADALVREGKVDLVGVGRAMLNDADWARKAIAQLRNA